MLKARRHVIEFLVVGTVVFLLASSLLELARPELKVAHLMDGQQREVQMVLPLIPQRVELRNRVRLYAKLQTTLDGQAPCPLVAQRLDAREVRVVVHVHHALVLHHLGRERLIPVGFDAVVHVIGEADLVEVILPGIRAHLRRDVPRVVREHAVHVVVSQHGGVLSP